MRNVHFECWPSCDGCDRQLPVIPSDTANVTYLLNLGWTFVEDKHFCPTCSPTRQEIPHARHP